MAAVVVDASLALKWAIPEQDSSIALALLANWLQHGVELHALALFACEITNVLFQHVRGKRLTTDEAKGAIQRIFAVGIELDALQSGETSLRALEIAEQFAQRATYDAHYLALAELEGSECWTADERLWRATHGTFTWVRWLGEYASQPGVAQNP